MNTGIKIRGLLLLLSISCFLTAYMIGKSVSERKLLNHEATILQKNLQAKENQVYQLLEDRHQYQQLQSLTYDNKTAEQFIGNYRSRGINLLIYQNQQLIFWTSYRVFPTNIQKIKEGTSFLQLKNGYYELVKKTDSNYTYLFLINIKSNYSLENQYLKNEFWPQLFNHKTLNIASITDKETAEIFSKSNELLFSVKLSSNATDNTFNMWQVWLWIFGIVLVSIVVNWQAASLVKHKRPWLAFIFLFSYFFILRWTDLKYFWFNHQFNLKIFDPTIYAESDFLPSLGDFLLNVLAVTWVCTFLYANRKFFHFEKYFLNNKVKSYSLLFLFAVAFSLLGFFIDDLFFGLVYNSKIDFNISNIINLGWVSWVCIFILCLVWLNIYFITDIFAEILLKLNIELKYILTSIAILFVIATGYKLYDSFNAYYIIYTLIFLAIIYRRVYINKFSLWLLAFVCFCMASLSALKYIKFEDIKGRIQKIELAKRLTSEDDPKVINAIINLEKELTKEVQVFNYFKQPFITQTYGFHSFLTRKYLDGYLSKFEYKISEYNAENQSLKIAENPAIEKYLDLVRSGTIKLPLTKYFYKLNDTFGFQSYFGIIPVIEGNELLGTLVIELNSKSFDFNSYFPDFLIDGKYKSDDDLAQYGLAFYKHNKLLKQSGNYVYPLENQNFRVKSGEVTFINENVEQHIFNHLVYSLPGDKLVVVSNEKMEYKARLATLSFFFLVFSAFAAISYIIIWIISNFNEKFGTFDRINRYLSVNANKILYKTRIQISIIFLVIVSLTVVGWSTFFNIKQEYLERQYEQMQDKVRVVQSAFEKRISLDGINASTEAQGEFNQFADMNGVFLNLYDLNGHLYLTSLPKLYDSGVIGRQMPPKAFLKVVRKSNSEFINNNETIGNFSYAAAYAPIKNANNQTVAYIGIPFYSNAVDYQEKIGPFINTLINIYALVFVLIGVFAVFIARQITEPLTFIEENIKKTRLGQHNKPIKWNRQDEIGVLIREYNKMIAELEVSANKLAKIERESAWREMAQQVAHEIKNPLTPLKLGVQLLERSWNEKDPKFQSKFEKFTKSFIEQIDSLAKIASEFSNFAKMPDTVLEKIELIPIINQAKDIFKNTENVYFKIINKTTKRILINADKDQMLRTFNNLFKNAIEAKHQDRDCVIIIQLNNSDNQVYIEVNDNGEGIAKEDQKDIFKPKFTTKSSGTGLGLALVKKAIENADGHIKFESEAKQGTSFYITIPLVDNA